MRPGRAPGSPENYLPFEGVVERLWSEWNETSLFRLTLMKGTPLPSSQKRNEIFQTARCESQLKRNETKLFPVSFSNLLNHSI